MKATEKMLNKLVEKGMAKEWVKGDMHRYYIQLARLDEAYSRMADDEKRHGQMPLNRRERESGKLWIEAETLEINSKGIDLHMGDEDTLVEILEDVTGTASKEEAAAEEATEANGMKLNNHVKIDHYIFGSGYSYTEDVEVVSSEPEQPITAEEWWNSLDSDFAAGQLDDNGWIEIRVETYAEDANPSIDDPVAKSEYVPD